MGGRRRLTAEDEHLWSIVARSVKPLRHKKQPPAKRARLRFPTKPMPESASVAAGAAGAAAMPTVRPNAGHRPVPIALRDKQRPARGRANIDARIDLHGLTQAQAHTALLRFLCVAQADGARVALVVTGKGTERANRVAAIQRGVLRRQVPIWLSLPEFRPFVLGFEDAHAGHGGQGALYVRLRRGR